MFEQTQQKKDAPTDGQPPSRYSAVNYCHEYSNNSNSNSKTNCSSDIAYFLTDFISYSKQLDSTENNLNVFQFENVEINKFWLKHFGVVNLSDHKSTFLELSVLGKGLNSA